MPFKTIDLTLPENFAPFDGDGRRKVQATAVYAKYRPKVTSLSMTRGMARMLIEQFMEAGYSNHSAAGATLWVIETWCYTHNVEIRIIKHPFGGYQVRQLEQDEDDEQVEEEQAEDFIPEQLDEIRHLDGRIRLAS
jgi:hypothetical protein